MRKLAWIFALTSLSFAGAENYTAQQVCSALVRAKAFEISGWEHNSLSGACESPDTSFSLKGYYKGNIRDTFYYRREKQTLTYQVQVVSYDFTKDLQKDLQLVKRDSHNKIYSSSNFIVIIAPYTKIRIKTINDSLAKSYASQRKDLIAKVGQKAVEDLEKKYQMNAEPDYSNVVEVIPEDILAIFEEVVRSLK